MPSIDQVCEAAATAITNTATVRAQGYASAKINEPDVHIFTREFDPRLVFGSTKKAMPCTARLFIKAIDDRSAQIAARGFMEPTSICAALNDGDNWNVDVDYAVVTQVGQPQQIELGGVVRWFVDFEFDVCF